MMVRKVQYVWLESEAFAVARKEFREQFLNRATILIIIAVFYVPIIWRGISLGSEVFRAPTTYLTTLGPVVVLALSYVAAIRSAKRDFAQQAKGTSPVTFEWDEKGLKASGETWRFAAQWHDYVSTDGTERFFRLHRAGRARPAYVFKRPMSQDQIKDFRYCVSIIQPESAPFL